MSRLKTHVALPTAWRRWPWAGWSAGLVWLLVAAAAVHWGLRLWVQGRAVPSQAQTVGVAQALQGDPARLFARVTTAPVVPAASPARDRFRVLGVAASGEAGFAVMSVDGKPPRAYRVGASVDAQWTVLSVSQRNIEIGPSGGPAAVSLDLPVLPAAATGRLSGVTDGGGLAAQGAPRLQRPSSEPGLAPNPPLPGGQMAPEATEAPVLR